jgi:hypothetical protein
MVCFSSASSPTATVRNPLITDRSDDRAIRFRERRLSSWRSRFFWLFRLGISLRVSLETIHQQLLIWMSLPRGDFDFKCSSLAKIRSFHQRVTGSPDGKIGDSAALGLCRAVMSPNQPRRGENCPPNLPPCLEVTPHLGRDCRSSRRFTASR